MDADVIVVGAGLAGLVAACELTSAGRRVLLVDQEGDQSLGGQAFWSFGGLFFVDSPEQRRMRIKDSLELAWQDWLGTAAFDRLDDEDVWPRRWAEAYVNFAAGEKRAWLHERGVRFFPIVGWAERGGYTATGHGNSVPRFHITWGTGPGLIAPFVAKAKESAERGLLRFAFRHRVDELTMSGSVVDGVRGHVLEPSSVPRAAPSSRVEIGEFHYSAQAVIVTSGGIGGNFDLVRQNWPARMGTPPKNMIAGVPDFVDGRMIAITEAAGGRVVNRDRMWHYVEGIHNYDPIWTNHGIRILPGPSSVWLDARGNRLPVPLFPGFDTLGTLEHIMTTGHDHTWFVLTKKIIGKEFGLSGSEQNPDLTGRSWRQVVDRARADMPEPVARFLDKGVDFVQADTLDELIERMNKVTDEPLLDAETVRREILARDREMDNDYTKDLQIAAMRQARAYFPDKVSRVASPHKLTDPKAGPMIAVRLNILTRKTLGGLNTDLDSRVLDAAGAAIGGLYAAGEVAGFGGGGVHGYRALEGTFLGGCIFSGRAAGRAAAAAVG
ncbi:MAG TPA: FAD-binding dehydrogenase [Jatrophihabitantaceae bacterium]|nr:FAD-binding dehydrogenase [Jatrophihabitantaceae bacterium]